MTASPETGPVVPRIAPFLTPSLQAAYHRAAFLGSGLSLIWSNVSSVASRSRGRGSCSPSLGFACSVTTSNLSILIHSPVGYVLEVGSQRVLG